MILSSAISFDSSSVRAATPKLSQTVISLPSGTSTTLKVSGTDKAVKWSSSDENIASVSKKGKVTGKNAGKAIITATIGKQTLQCRVIVRARLSRTKVTLVRYERIFLCLKGASIKRISSSEHKVASVSIVKEGKEGMIIGLRRGRATITVVDTTGRKYTCIVKVEEPYQREKYITLEEGQSYRLRLNDTTQKISWSSRNEKVACVNSVGFVTARSKGGTYIYAKVGSKSFSFYIKVLAKKKPEVTPTATPTPTVTPEPTATPTPEPTATPIPTATPEPTATPIPWYPSYPDPEPTDPQPPQIDTDVPIDTDHSNDNNVPTDTDHSNDNNVSTDNNVPIDTDHSNDNNVPTDSDTDSGSHLLF